MPVGSPPRFASCRQSFLFSVTVASLSWLPAAQAEELEPLARELESVREVPFPYRIEYRRIHVGRSGVVPIAREEFAGLLRKFGLAEGGQQFKAFCDETCLDAKVYDLPWQSGTGFFDGPRSRIESESTKSGTQAREKDFEVQDGRTASTKSHRDGRTQIDVDHQGRLTPSVEPRSFRLVPDFSQLVGTTLETRPGLIVVSGRLEREKVVLSLDDKTRQLKEDWRSDGENVTVVSQLGAFDVSGVTFPRFVCRAKFKKERLFQLTAMTIDAVEKVDLPAPELFTMPAAKGDTIVDHTRQGVTKGPQVYFAPTDTQDLARTLTSSEGWADP